MTVGSPQWMSQQHNQAWNVANQLAPFLPYAFSAIPGMYGPLAASAYGAHQHQQAWDQYRRDIREDIREGTRPLHEARGEIMPAAQQLSGKMLTTGEQYYSPQAVAGRWQGAMGGLAGEYGALPGQYARGAGQLVGQYQRGAGQLMGGYGQREAQMAGAYGGRTQRGMEMIQGLGAQAEADINRDFRHRQAAENAYLQSRGLGSSTVATGTARGVERERQDALARHREGVRAQQYGAYADLSGQEMLARMGLGGERLGAGMGLLQYGTGLQQNVGQFGAGLGMDALAGRAGIGMNQLGYQDAATQAQLGNMYTAGTMPFEYNLATAQPIANFYGNINRYPPTEPRWAPYPNW